MIESMIYSRMLSLLHVNDNHDNDQYVIRDMSVSIPYFANLTNY